MATQKQFLNFLLHNLLLLKSSFRQSENIAQKKYFMNVETFLFLLSPFDLIISNCIIAEQPQFYYFFKRINYSLIVVNLVSNFRYVFFILKQCFTEPRRFSEPILVEHVLKEHNNCRFTIPRTWIKILQHVQKLQQLHPVKTVSIKDIQWNLWFYNQWEWHDLGFALLSYLIWITI